MSGSSEERPAAADGSVEQKPEEAPATEAAAPDTRGPEEVEMTAAEALARATEAAAGDAREKTAVVQESDAAPETAGDGETSTAPDTEGTGESAASTPAAAVELASPTETDTAEEERSEAAAEATDDGQPPPEPAAKPERVAAGDVQEPAAAEATTDADAEPAKEAVSEPAEKTDEEVDAEPVEKAVAEPAEGADAKADEKPDARAAEEAASVGAVADEETPKEEEPAEKATATPPPDRPELKVVREAMANRQPLEGRVIGWNNGGFHLALAELSAFCPRSEMEIGDVHDPESYLDKTFLFRVLRLQGKGRRIVVSRAAQLRKEKSRQRSQLRKQLQVGAELDGTVASLKDFGAFVDLGGAQGLVHVSEISHRRVEHPSDELSEGQQVRVKVLRVEQGGRRISLSMRALEPDPWKDLAKRFPRGAVVKGTVEKANQLGAFVELAPGVTGLLPARSMSIPRETTPARAYPPGKEVSVQIVSVDPRRQRISLALEGSGLEGSRSDYQEYQRQSREQGEGEGFNALASAFRRLEGGTDQ